MLNFLKDLFAVWRHLEVRDSDPVRMGVDFGQIDIDRLEARIDARVEILEGPSYLQCRGCKYYFNSHHIWCAPHPSGVSSGVCPDYEER